MTPTFARAPRVRIEWLVISITLVVAIAIPFYLEKVSLYWLHVLIIAYFYAILASSWSLLAGVAGQFSFGHMAFMAIGGYTSGLLGKYFGLPPLLGIPAGTLVAGLTGLAIGVLCLRFKASYLALFTIAFSEILRILIRGEYGITRGDQGLHLEMLFGATTSKLPYYFTMLALLVFSLLFMYWLVNSRVGLFLRAIREDEEAASARGVDVVRYKLMAFVITSMIAGLAGGFFAHYIGILTPNTFVLPQMGLVIAMAIIGGVESLVAAAIGGIIIQVSLEVLRDFDAWRLVIFGALLVITLRFARNGLIAPLLERLFGLGPRAEKRKKESDSHGV
ncbi:MAG: branched-chain amino acid ABC transporter permease [Chloroflexi bacterium]|nr:branched-chain amino acid ABC transporter permease [Chloroflexota bacterium]